MAASIIPTQQVFNLHSTIEKPAETAAAYGENCSEFYDQIYCPAQPAVIETLKRLAGCGRVLELGVGTGRIALPLAALGVDICGIEASPSMLARLAQKPGGAQLEVRQGNFAEASIEGPFSLIFALVSTFFLLDSHAEQQKSFQTLGAELSPGGLLLLENYEPSGLESSTQSCPNAEVVFLSEQMIETEQGPRCYRARICYTAPPELDKMANRAGLRLRERWSNWQGLTFHPGDPLHISIYERGL